MLEFVDFDIVFFLRRIQPSSQMVLFLLQFLQKSKENVGLEGNLAGYKATAKVATVCTV